MPILTPDQFHATMGTPMTSLQDNHDFQPVPLGDYFSSIPVEDLEGHDFTTIEIERVYRDPTRRWVHVLLSGSAPNVYLVIVVDEPDQSIAGHHLLDLHSVYGA